jgi:hypothetical protein
MKLVVWRLFAAFGFGAFVGKSSGWSEQQEVSRMEKNASCKISELL